MVREKLRFWMQNQNHLKKYKISEKMYQKYWEKYEKCSFFQLSPVVKKMLNNEGTEFNYIWA